MKKIYYIVTACKRKLSSFSLLAGGMIAIYFTILSCDGYDKDKKQENKKDTTIAAEDKDTKSAGTASSESEKKDKEKNEEKDL